jgi:transcriptional regulator of acetoin/glycerol metabolism
VRQLHHVLRTAVALADGAALRPEHLPSLRDDSTPSNAAGEEDGAAAALAPEQAQERQSLLDVLESARWNVSQVAKGLGVSRNTLYRRMHRLHIPLTQSG